MFRQNGRTLGVFFVLSLGIGALAQTAQFSGRVTDPQQAVVRDAEIRVVNQATGVERKVKTNTDGLYAVPFVQPGTYQVFVQAKGFSTAVSEAFTVTVGQALVFDVQLKVGNATEQVTVNANDQDINTTDASVSTVVDRQFVENLPLNGRSFQALLYMTPGVNLNAGAGITGNGYSAGEFVVNGQRGDANYWMVDGVGANVGISTGGLTGVAGHGVAGALGATNALGGTSALVSVDALQEFRIETSTYAPEFGRSPGGQISVETRSGTNSFHGTAFDYLRNTVLDATDWFASHNGLHKAAEIQNDFGGVVGGPITKHKTFFFFSYEGLRVRQPSTFLGTVPDLASRTAALPAVQPYLNAYPLPQPGVADVGPGYAPYNATFTNPGSTDAYSLRIDHHLTDNLNLFARYGYAPSQADVRGVPGDEANTVNAITELTRTLTAGVTWTATSHVVNDVRFNYSISGGSQKWMMDDFGGGTPLPSDGVLSPGYNFQNSAVFLLQNFGSNMSDIRGFGSHNSQQQYNAVDTLSLQRGAHSLKFGVDYRRLTPHFQDSGQELVVPLFLSTQDLENGQTYFTIAITTAPGRFLLHNLGAFAQDTWRASSRLNLTYGLRWDVDFAPSPVSGPNYTGLTGFSLTGTSNLAFGRAGTPPYSTQYGNVAPRIGGAYRISTSPDWGLVIRGGFGVFYGLVSTELASQATDDVFYPWGATIFNYGASFPTVTPIAPIEPPSVQNGYTTFGFDPHLNLPYALEWNVALEQSLGQEQTLKLSYIGASDKRTLASETINSPLPQYVNGFAVLVANNGTLSYNALQAQFQRRMAKGLQALLSYTWSHSIDTGSYGTYSNGSFADPNVNRGDSDYDLRNVFTAAVTYGFPTLKRNALTRQITGGWSLDNVAQARSGPPIDVQDDNFSALSASSASAIIRPDVVPGVSRYLTGTLCDQAFDAATGTHGACPGSKMLNWAAFTDPPSSGGFPTRQGTLGRNALRALGLAEWDFTVRRDFPIYERMKLQFRADLFNVLNHPTFSPFNNGYQTTSVNGVPALSNTDFGLSTSMLNQYLGGAAGTGSQNALYAPGGPRSGELALKIIF